MSKLNWKRIVSMTLVVIMLFSMLPMGALAEAINDDAAAAAEEVATPEPTPLATEAAEG